MGKEMPFITTPSGQFGYFNTGTGTGTEAAATPPTNLVISRTGRNTVSCTWTAGEPAPDLYQVFLDSSTDQVNYTSYAGDTVYTTTASFTAPRGRTYKFYVIAYYSSTQTSVNSDGYSNVV